MNIDTSVSASHKNEKSEKKVAYSFLLLVILIQLSGFFKSYQKERIAEKVEHVKGCVEKFYRESLRKIS